MIDLSKHKIIIENRNLHIRHKLTKKYIDLYDLLKTDGITYRSRSYSADKSQLNEVLKKLGYKIKDKSKCQN